MQANQYDTMVDATQDLRKRGFTEDFLFDESGCTLASTGEKVLPNEVTIVEHHRFEGLTSPSDMAVVYAIFCQNGAKGIIVDSYGVYANQDIADFLQNVQVKED